MSDNLQIIKKKLEHLARMRADVAHSIKKMPGPLEKIDQGDVSILTADERETLSAFTIRFATYQEHMGKTMKSVAIEEESATSPFGAILALMEKLKILDSTEHWKEIRELRNAVNHEYEEDAQALHQILGQMVLAAPWLFLVHEKLALFVQTTYQKAPSGP
jgi:chromatin segregation and condensation protein Rec8/ScpA/Scc1 (kleisin family)